MAFKVTFLGHATFMMDIGGHQVLLDPFLTGNPAAEAAADDLNPDTILVSHGHGDHIVDAEGIAKRTGAKLIANAEIAGWFRNKGLENVHGQHIGGGYHHEFGYVKFTIAHHGSSLPDGSYGGSPAGFLITVEGKTVYFACDTALFGDMALYGDEGIDLAFLPIGDNFTMGPDDALKAIKLLRPKKVVPVHYNTWPPIEQDGDAWVKRVNAETDTMAVALVTGGSIEA